MATDFWDLGDSDLGVGTFLDSVTQFPGPDPVREWWDLNLSGLDVDTILAKAPFNPPPPTSGPMFATWELDVDLLDDMTVLGR